MVENLCYPLYTGNGRKSRHHAEGQSGVDLSVNLIFVLKDETKFGKRDYEIESLLQFCFTKGVSVETVQTLMNEISSLGESALHEQEQVGEFIKV